MNQDNAFKVFCPRCGSEMNSNSRYCMKCGYLNPNDPANQNMQQYIPQQQVSSYQIGSGQTITHNSEEVTTAIASNTGNKKNCFLINYLLYMFIIIVSYFLIVGSKATNFEAVKNSLFPYVAFITSIVFLFVYSMELVFMKANKRWWHALIPFYCLFVLTDIVFKKKWLGILLLIPGIGQVFFLVTLYVLGSKFKYNGLLTMLLPVIYIPMMGFGSRLYEGVNYISEEKTLEKDYKRKKIFFISLMIFLILGGALIFWTNIIEIKGKASKITHYYYVFATNQIVDKTKQLAKENYLECEDYPYNESSGIYYVEYADIGSVAYLPLYYMRDVISGYVVIDNSNGESKYYVSLSDGVYGYPETLSNEVNFETIVPYEKIKSRTDLNICRNTKHKVTVGEM